MTDDEVPPPPPGISYPTHYTFKAVGKAVGKASAAAEGASEPDVRARVVAHVAAVVGKVEDSAVSVRPSSGGKYESVSVSVFLQSEEQRRRVYHAFHGDKSIVWYV